MMILVFVILATCFLQIMVYLLAELIFILPALFSKMIDALENELAWAAFKKTKPKLKMKDEK